MSENDIATITNAIGRLEERTETTNRNIERLINAIDMIKTDGCSIGKEHSKTIAELERTAKDIKAVWRKALIIMAGVGIGSVGLEKTVKGIFALLDLGT